MLILLGLLLAPVAAEGAGAPVEHRDHNWPGLATGQTGIAGMDGGPEMQRGRPAADLLADHRRLDAALAALAPQRKGVVDAYVVVVALDSDPVFGREAREAAKVLARRYDAAGRTIVLAGDDARSGDVRPLGSITALTLALARVAELMDKKEDALVLYTTGHGADIGLAYHYGDTGYGILSPKRLADLLDGLGIRRRLLILSACYSGVFVPALDTRSTAILTAAAADRTSFGCGATDDWTYFGDALINRALRKPQGLAAASNEAEALIAGWEFTNRVEPSNPQTRIGADVGQWLTPLEARMPKTETQPVGSSNH